MTTIYVAPGTELPQRAVNDLYETEETLIQAFVKRHMPKNGVRRILDPGAGDGRWGRIAAEHSSCNYVVGVELEDRPWPGGTWAAWYPNQDYLTWETDDMFDWIVGNPPYFLAEEFIRKSWGLLMPGGTMAFLLRLSFMEGVGRYHTLWNDLWLNEVAVCSRRPSFYGGKTNGTAFGIFIWKKLRDGTPAWKPREWKTTLLLHDRDKNHRGAAPTQQKV